MIHAPAGRPLRERLTILLRRCGFSRTAIVVTDDSRRSARANARAVGMAGACRIELSDTLVSLLATDEIEAVTAHEAGHLRLHHRARIWSPGSYLALWLLRASKPLPETPM